jgi:hypothetical protein
MGGGGHLRRRSRFRASHPSLVQSNLTHSMRQKIVSRTDDPGRPRLFPAGGTLLDDLIAHFGGRFLAEVQIGGPLRARDKARLSGGSFAAL